MKQHLPELTTEGGLSLIPCMEVRQLGVCMVDVYPEIKVASAREAEAIVFRYGSVHSSRLNGSPGAFLSTYIKRASSLIAARSRRAFGNRVFIHPSQMPMITLGFVPSKKTPMGDWNFEGLINNQIEVYSSDFAPPTAVHVVLVNGHDAPAQMIYANGAHYITPLAARPATLSIASDYIERIEIV